MTETDLVEQPVRPTAASQTERMFPTLTPAQIARVAAQGRVRAIHTGEVLAEPGAPTVPFFLVTAGQIAIVRPTGTTEELITVHRAGQFTGEISRLTGRRALLRARVIASGEVVELNRDRLLGLVQTDAELSEIIMRAFILRRLELIAHGFGDVVLLRCLIGLEFRLGLFLLDLGEQLVRIRRFVRRHLLAEHLLLTCASRI